MRLHKEFTYLLVTSAISMSGLVLAQVRPPTVPGVSPDVLCKRKLLSAATSGATVHAVIVTNDSQSQAATYLLGDIAGDSFNPTGNISGGLAEYSSQDSFCLNEPAATTCTGKVQPFSAKTAQNAKLSISRSGDMSITWPGGGVTTPIPTCLSNKTFVFQENKYTGVLTLIAQPSNSLH